jgi:hypothetical protein
MTGKAQKKTPSKSSGGTKGTPIKKKKPLTKTEANTIRNKALFLELFLKTGNITAACKNGRIGRQTFYAWMKSDLQFKQDFEDAEDALIDFAEGKLMNLIDEKNVPATLFMLKCKGKDRGWIEPTYLDVRGGLKHSLTHRVSLKEMKKSYDRIKRKDQK